MRPGNFSIRPRFNSYDFPLCSSAGNNRILSVNFQALTVSKFMETRKGPVASAKEFENWVEEYHDMIYSTIYRLTWNEDDALDLTQDVFLQAYKKMHTFRGEAAASTWLTRIALNTAYNFLNRSRSKHWNEIKEEHLAHNDDGDPSPAPSLDIKQLERLSPLERTVVLARIRQDLPYREIAASLDTSENSVKVAWSKAVKKLREWMK